MTTPKKPKIGLSTKVYKFFLSLYFNTKIGRRFSETHGLSFDPTISVSQMPVIMPSKDDFFTLASDLNKFEILDIDEERLDITIREICTDNVFTLSLDLFEALFVKVDKPKLDGLIKKAKS